MNKLTNYPLFTALITPLTEGGKIDFESLRSLLKTQESAGNGVLILGSTGEALNLAGDEKIHILKFVESQKLSVPIMAGVGGINLETTLDWINTLKLFSIQSYLLVTPPYAKPGDKGQFEWFKNLLDASSRPCVLYNVPSRTGISLSLKAVSELKNHRNFFGLKEASGSIEDFKKYRNAAPNAFMYSGDDAYLPDFIPHGAKGLISVASNVWPKKTHQLVNLFLKNQFNLAQVWKESCQSLFLASNPVPVKYLMHQKKMISSPELRPPLNSGEDFPKIKLIQADKKIEDLGENHELE